MLTFTTEVRTYVGQASTVAVDDYAGFQLGRPYDISYLRRYDGSVVLCLMYIPGEIGTS